MSHIFQLFFVYPCIEFTVTYCVQCMGTRKKVGKYCSPLQGLRFAQRFTKMCSKGRRDREDPKTMAMRLSQQRWALRASSVAAVAVSAEAFSLAPVLSRASPALARASLRPGAGRTALAPAAARGAGALLMAGAGGKAVELDSAGFDTGDADPIGSIAALDKVCPAPCAAPRRASKSAEALLPLATCLRRRMPSSLSPG
jgi:hypothetical protein